MSFTNRIANSDFNNKDISSLPDVPTMGAADLKARFDANAKEIIAPKHNGLIDELQSASAASNIGATAPMGRTGSTIQEVTDVISSALSSVEEVAHSHENKENCLDYLSDSAGTLNYRGQPISGGGGGSYTAGNGIAINGSVISAKLDSDTMEFSSGNIKAKNSHTHANKSLLDSYTQTEANLSDAVSKKHEHSNLEVLELLKDADGKLQYNSNPIGTTVGWNQITLPSAGTKIASITIDGDTTDVYAPTSGGGGGGATSLSQLDDVSLSTQQNGQTLKYDSATSKWKNATLGLSDVNGLNDALNGKLSTSGTATSELNNDSTLPVMVSNAQNFVTWGTIKSLLQTAFNGIYALIGHTHVASDITSGLASVATSGSYNDLSNTPELANVATSGSYNDLSNTPTIPSTLAELTGDATHRVVTDTEKSTWNGKVDSVSVSRTGTASSTVTSAQVVSITDAGGSAVSYEVDGSKYMERKNYSSTSYVFTNSAITTDSTIYVDTNTWGDNPSNVTVTNGSCTVTFASAITRNVRIYIR